MKKMTTQQKIIDILGKGPRQIEDLSVTAGVTRETVEKALKVLREKGVVAKTQNPHYGGRGRPMVTYHLTGRDEAIDWTPNRRYNGPSYTYFLQGIWNEPRVQTIAG